MQNDGDERTLPLKAGPTLRKRAHVQEYLLKELISQEFLPARRLSSSSGHLRYHASCSFLATASKKERRKRWPTCFCGESCPVVPLSSALTEYAPAIAFAINSRVAAGQGHNPELAYSRFRRGRRGTRRTYETAGRCRNCGSFGTAASRSLTTCGNCGAA